VVVFFKRKDQGMYKVDIQNKRLIELSPAKFATLGLRERFDIQEWVEECPTILGEELLVIGKEVTLPFKRRLDLLCIDKRASLVVVELKRDDSGTDVEWQAIKYASFCSSFLSDEIYQLYARYLDSSEYEAQKKIEEFIAEDIEDLNQSQRIILVSNEFNSEVISAVLWLRDFGVDIECVRLGPYTDSNNELFIKPEVIIPLPEARNYIEKKEKKVREERGVQPEWTGYWFVNVGEGPHRTWEDNREYGFIGAGQGKWYSDALKRLSIGDKIYAYMKGRGYVGFGEVTHKAVMIKDFIVPEHNKPLLELDLKAERPHENSDDEELSEWVIGLKWIKTIPKDQAKTFSGVFANQNVVCKLRHEQTLRFVQQEFGQ
jgi:hypothetical protein